MLRSAAVVLVVLVACDPGASAEDEPRAVAEIRHELTSLPQYGVFDLITFEYDKGMVTLAGYVTDASLKHAAEKAVRKVEGVEQVTNRIESLPTSKADEDLREKVYAALYRDSPLSRYESAVDARSAIRIIVNRGNVMLVGVVDRLEDKELAGLKTKGVFGVRAVDNRLQTAAQLRSPDDR